MTHQLYPQIIHRGMIQFTANEKKQLNLQANKSVPVKSTLPKLGFTLFFDIYCITWYYLALNILQFWVLSENELIIEL